MAYRSAGREVLLRRAERGTRRLQATETSLRNEGFLLSPPQLAGDGWLCYYAEKDGRRYHVREQITDGRHSWASPSAWFWHATLHPKSGPWIAATVLTPLAP